jgi:hypothetical protein
MARKYTVTFNDGTKHEYNNAPDDLSQEALTAQAAKDFPSKAITHLDREQTTGEYINGLVRSAAQGATFGFADEGEAALESLFTKPGVANVVSGQSPYETALAKQRAMNKAFADENPVSAFLSSGAGSIASGAGALKLGAKVAPAIYNAFTKLNPYVQASIGGAGGGFLGGFGEGEGGFLPRLQNAAISGTAGAVLGPVIQGVGQGVQYARSSAADRAKSRVLNNLARDQMTPDQAMARLDELGPVSTLADLGPNMQGLATAVASVPGQGKTAAKLLDVRHTGDTVSSETSGQAQRIVEAGQKALGDANYYGTIDDLMTKAKNDAAPLYDAAYKNNPIFGTTATKGLERDLQTPAAKKAMARAIEIAGNEKVDPRGLGLTIDAAGNATVDLSGKANMRTLDYIKRGLDDVLNAERDPLTGKLKLDEATKAILDLKNSYVGHLKKLNPDYEAALNAYAGPAASRDAMELGRAALDPERALEITAKRVADLSDTDRAFFRQGVARQIKDIVTGAPDGADAVKKIFGNQKVRAKLAAAFPDEASFKQFAKTMQAEAQMASTRNAVLTGSPTAPRIENIRDLGPDMLGDAVDIAASAATGNTTGLLTRAGKAIASRTGQRVRESTANELAKTLFTPSALAREDIRRLLNDPFAVASMNPRLAGLLASSSVAGANRMNQREPLRLNINKMAQ